MSRSEADEERPLALAVLAEVDRLADRALWPGFEPRRLPLALYDGAQTWLARHPAPPAEFLPDPAGTEAHVYPGLHPVVRANTSATLAGRRLATVMLAGSRRRSVPELAALVVHELFHVYQRERHPDWEANELDLFAYPMDDADLLALRRLETAALRRAWRAPHRAERERWAAAALALRRDRFARLPAGAAAYERGSELNEGLASYVDGKALGDADAEQLLAADFPADGVRARTYAAGRCLALLLDDLAPGWKAALDAGPTRPLDSLLAEALAAVAPAAVASEERDRALEQAQADVAALQAGRAARRDAFLALPGARLVVAADAGPLRPRGFDPSNVVNLGDGQVLHTRFLKLGNALGELEVLGAQALTESAGRHPFLDGVRQATIAGFGSELALQETAEGVEMRGDGVTAMFRQATVARDGEAVTVVIRG